MTYLYTRITVSSFVAIDSGVWNCSSKYSVWRSTSIYTILVFIRK